MYQISVTIEWIYVKDYFKMSSIDVFSLIMFKIYKHSLEICKNVIFFLFQYFLLILCSLVYYSTASDFRDNR